MDVEAHGPCESAAALGGSSSLYQHKKNKRVNETTASTSLCSDAAINGIGHLGLRCPAVLVPGIPPCQPQKLSFRDLGRTREHVEA